MNTWMNYTDTERKQMLERTSASIAEHFAIAIVKKDWWEEFQKAKPRTLRMSRHYYDLWKLMQSPYFDDVLGDMSLYQAIVQHRATYYNIHYVNYALLQPNTISILPPDHLLREYEQDYASMLESYIYGSAPSFAELMEAMEQLQNRIRNINNSQKRIKR